MADPWKNQLYFGDNLTILREHIPDASVDLIYLDPPFNSNATYNVLFAEHSGEKSAAQIAAFAERMAAIDARQAAEGRAKALAEARKLAAEKIAACMTTRFFQSDMTPYLGTAPIVDFSTYQGWGRR